MDPVSYSVVFDIGHRAPQYLWLLAIPVVMVTVGVAAFRDPRSSGNRRFIAIWTGFAATVGIVFAYSMVSQYMELRSALASGHYTVVEGVVTDFTPEPRRGHGAERFTVVTPTGRETYTYSFGAVTQGFNETNPHGGPMRNGLRVRIADVHGVIARLEIAE